MKVYVVNLGRKYLYLQWMDPETGRRITRSSKCKTRRDAERKASILENQLSGGDPVAGRHRWSDFIALYQCEHLSGLASKTELKAVGVLESFEQRMSPAALSAVNAAMISRYVSHLRDDGRSEATIAGHVRQLRASLRWAKDRGLIGAVPPMPRIQRVAGARIAKGRPLSSEEFARMMKASKTICPTHWKSWVRILRGLWLSGLRLGEACALRWEPGNWPHVRLDRGDWLVIPASFDKSHRDRSIPLPPDFAAWLHRTPAPLRHGHIFVPLGEEGSPVRFFRVSQVISQIGKAANIITDPASGRTATAHDLRRAFAQRWASRLTPVDLQRLMRHSSIQTTLGYYLDEDAEGLAKRMNSTFHSTPE